MSKLAKFLKMTDETYDLVKELLLYFSPGLIGFCNTVLPACGVSASAINGITAVIGGVSLLVGIALGISNSNYKKENNSEQNN